MKRHYRTTFLFTLGLLAPVLASGAELDEQDVKAFDAMFGAGPQEEDLYRVDQLLITATGSLKPVHLAPSVATVITKEDIEEIGATSLDQILETVPGLHVAPSGTTWFSSIWSLRGIHTSDNPEVLLLINGVPFTSNYVGNRNFCYRMPVAMISRVEVIRGPGSALYGADAYSGVVNVITKDNFEIEGTEMGLRAGSFSTLDGWLQHGGQYRGWDVTLGLEWRKSDGDTDADVEQDRLHALGFGVLSNAPGAMDTSYETLDAHLQLRKGDWDFHLYGSLQEQSVGPGGAQAITYNNDFDAEYLLSDLTYRNDHFLTDWDLSCRLYYSYIFTDALVQYYPPSFLDMQGNPIVTSEDGGAELAAVFSGLRGHKLRFGVGWKNYEFEPDQYKNFTPIPTPPFIAIGPLRHITDADEIYISDANRQLYYALVQDEWKMARKWELTAGVRYDEYSDFGSTVNPRAALVWETRYDLTTKLLFSQAFRAPTFAEQYIKNNPVGVGQDDIDPQTIETVELAFDYQPTVDLRLKLNLFHYEADDLIDLTGNALPQVFDNYAEQEGDGFEIELDWQVFEQLRLRSNFAYQRSENKTVDHVVHDAPQMQFYLNPHWKFAPDWSLDGQYFWIGDRHRQFADSRNDIDDYDMVNLTLRRKNINDHLDVAFNVRNIFDEDIREPSPYDSTAPQGAFIPEDYPINSRSIWAEVRVRF
ncbi:MAG: TonB-dependent receptor [Desulfobulbaceae bacterium]|nr:TonB-dependent receptor [Desulfobulbaceae bacterium]